MHDYYCLVITTLNATFHTHINIDLISKNDPDMISL